MLQNKMLIPRWEGVCCGSVRGRGTRVLHWLGVGDESGGAYGHLQVRSKQYSGLM